MVVVGCWLSLAWNLPAGAQHLPVGDAVEDYVRVMQLVGRAPMHSHVVRPLDGRRSASVVGLHPWRHLMSRDARSGSMGGMEFLSAGATSETFWNSDRPWGQNDGAVWQGRGVTTAFSTGFFAKGDFFEAAVRPRFLHSANADFDLSPISVHPLLAPWGYPGRNDIDLPQRFGPDAITEIYPGATYLQAEYHGIGVGFSTENMWWGPGIRNSIIMGNNAGGFRHAYVRTLAPKRIGIGSLEGSWIWGSVGQTKFFTDVSDNPNPGQDPTKFRRFLTGMVLSYQPKWIEGLYVGASQSYMVHATEPVYFADFFSVINLPFYEDTERHSQGTDDKMVSIFGRWVFRHSGLEVYGEWARGDHTSNLRDIFVTPDHARGFTLGFQKVYELSERYLTRVAAEHTFLESNREAGFRDNTVRGQTYFYTHEGIKQGYTHRGQVIGAGIGPGSQGQFFRFDLFGPFGRIGLFGLRQVFDNDLYYQLKDNNFEHEVSIAGGLTWFTFYNGFEFGGEISRVKTFNRYFDFNNIEYNTHLELSLRYVLGYR